MSLLSFGLDRVAAEPERLAAESRANKKETETHAVDNYGAFLESAVCVRNVREELESSGGLLHGLAARVPELRSAIQEVAERARIIETERTDVMTTLKQHNQLLEILEVPQLLDTAVRNEYYEEALDLAAFARKLEARHSDVHLTKELVAAVDVCEQQLMQQLLAKLQSNIQLPVCLHVIGLLRRLGKHTDSELRFTFLQCRDAFLQSAVDKATRGGDAAGRGAGTLGAYAVLCKFTDLIRMHMFEIVTQYRAIFLDFNSAQEDSEASGDGGLMYAWANHRLSHYLDALAHGLPHLKEGSQIVSVLEKAMYGGAYLGREGLDFRGALTPLFEGRVLSLLSHGLSLSHGAFEAALQSQRISAMPPALKARYDEASKGQVFQPPSSLLDHPPLAVLCNKMSEVLNEVRECAILSIKSRAHAAVEACLHRCAQTLAMLWVEEEGVMGTVLPPLHPPPPSTPWSHLPSPRSCLARLCRCPHTSSPLLLGVSVVPPISLSSNPSAFAHAVAKKTLSFRLISMIVSRRMGVSMCSPRCSACATRSPPTSQSVSS